MWNFIISLIQCPPNRQADTGCTKYLRIKHIFMHGLTLYLHKEAESSLCTFIAEHNCSLQDHCHHHIHCPPIFPAKKGRMTALRQISPTRMHPTVKQFIWHRHTINFQFEGAYPTLNVHKQPRVAIAYRQRPLGEITSCTARLLFSPANENAPSHPHTKRGGSPFRTTYLWEQVPDQILTRLCCYTLPRLLRLHWAGVSLHTEFMQFSFINFNFRFQYSRNEQLRVFLVYVELMGVHQRKGRLL